MENSITKTYIWYRDKKILGMILLFIAIGFQIFAFFKVPFLSSIHGYTIGLLIGFYNPLFYIFIVWISLNIIFGEKFKLPKWFKLNTTTYWVVMIFVIFISVSVSYPNKTGWAAIGSSPWKSFEFWYEDFTIENNAWFPANTNGGVIGVFMYSLFAMMLSGIGALIASIVMIFIILSYIITGSSIGFYKQLRESKGKNIKELIFKKSNKTNDSNIKSEEITKEPEKNEEKITINNEQKIETKNNENDILPFDDPF